MMIRIIFSILLISLITACGSSKLAPLSNKGAYIQPTIPTTTIVKNGDNLHLIARRYGVNLNDLIAENQLRPPYVIIPGQVLRLPFLSRYTVQASDTLYSISRKYNIDMATLAQVNQIRHPYLLIPGNEITIPGLKFNSNIHTTSLPKPLSRSSGKFAWPVVGDVVKGFGPQGGGIHNDGIDISAKIGSPIVAADNGVVAYIGDELSSLGNLLLIIHSDSWVTAYAHTQEILVQIGDTVKRGQLVATTGISKSLGIPLLHFEIRRGKEAVNPLDHLG